MLFSELDRGMGLPGRNHEGAVFPSPHLTNRTRCSCWPWSPSSCTARLSALLTGGCCAATAFYFLHIVCVSCFTPPFLEITPSGCGPWARGSPEGAASGWLLSGRLLCNQWIRSPLPGGGILFLLTVSSECRGFSAGPSASLTSGRQNAIQSSLTLKSLICFPPSALRKKSLVIRDYIIIAHARVSFKR